ncbi:MAG: prominin family protein [Treponema sp.]|nr:prominin family protein [Treponema sp.]
MENDEEYMKEDPWNVNKVASANGEASSDGGNGNAAAPYFSAEDLGKISMAFGIISFFFYHILFAILGLVFGFMSRSKSKNSSATVGIVCSCITLAAMFFFFIGIAVIVLACIPAITEWFDRIKDSLPSIYGF